MDYMTRKIIARREWKRCTCGCSSRGSLVAPRVEHVAQAAGGHVHCLVHELRAHGLCGGAFPVNLEEGVPLALRGDLPGLDLLRPRKEGPAEAEAGPGTLEVVGNAHRGQRVFSGGGPGPEDGNLAVGPPAGDLENDGHGGDPAVCGLDEPAGLHRELEGLPPGRWRLRLLLLLLGPSAAVGGFVPLLEVVACGPV